MPRVVQERAVVVAVVGPTATGKSDLGVALTRALGGEVVNADASQLYRGMDVGTAKLPPHLRAGVPHHLLDVLDVTAEARVAAYQTAARAAFAEVGARGRVPVLVGGSGLYVRAALDALEFPATDAAVRAALEAELEAVGAGALHARLAAVDPAAAAVILPTNTRRVVRALEVHELTGRPFSASMPEAGRYAVPAVQVGLRAEREVLRERIAVRVARMLDAGLVAEVEQLLARGLREGSTARRSLGYAQVIDALDGLCTIEEAAEATVHATRRYARRQLSWFGRDPRVTWLDADRLGPEELLDAALAVVRPTLGR